MAKKRPKFQNFYQPEFNPQDNLFLADQLNQYGDELDNRTRTAARMQSRGGHAALLQSLDQRDVAQGATDASLQAQMATIAQRDREGAATIAQRDRETAATRQTESDQFTRKMGFQERQADVAVQERAKDRTEAKSERQQARSDTASAAMAAFDAQPDATVAAVRQSMVDELAKTQDPKVQAQIRAEMLELGEKDRARQRAVLERYYDERTGKTQTSQATTAKPDETGSLARAQMAAQEGRAAAHLAVQEGAIGAIGEAAVQPQKGNWFQIDADNLYTAGFGPGTAGEQWIKAVQQSGKDDAWVEQQVKTAILNAKTNWIADHAPTLASVWKAGAVAATLPVAGATAVAGANAAGYDPTGIMTPAKEQAATEVAKRVVADVRRARLGKTFPMAAASPIPQP